MLKRSICLSLVLILAIAFVCGVSADDDSEPALDRYTHAKGVGAGLSISGSTAICVGKGRGTYSYTTTNILVTLQRQPAGSSSWSNVTSWTATASGMNTALVNETYPASSGYSYRVRTRCQIKDSDGNVLETVYKYSSIWTI